MENIKLKNDYTQEEGFLWLARCAKHIVDKGSVLNTINGVDISHHCAFINFPHQYEIIPNPPEPEYIPYTDSDIDLVHDRAMKEMVKSKITGDLFLISGFASDGLYFPNHYLWSQLLKLYTWKDGSPCGKIKND